MIRFVIAAAMLMVASPAIAQTPTDCPGTIEVIRFSSLKPGKTIDDFRKVVDQHMAWYRRHGYTKNQQIVAPVITLSGIDPTKVVTFHINAPGLKQDDHDAEWENFVAAYTEVSKVEMMRTVCLPK